MADEGARSRVERIWNKLQELALIVRCGKDGVRVIGGDRDKPEAQKLIRELGREYDADPKLVGDVVGHESGGRFGSGRKGGPMPSRY